MNFVQKIIDKAKHSPTQLPTRISIPSENISSKDKVGVPFESEKYYFQIRINELFLKDKRNWYKEFAPMVFVVSQYTYNGKEETVPFVVGPQIMDKFGQSLPNDMIFLNTRVAGLHPFRGGQITLSIILYQYKVGDYSERILRTLESTANIFSFATAFDTYIKIAGVIFEGVESLLGLQDVNPLIGLRIQMDEDADDLRSGYFALINVPEGTIDENKLWVKNNQLLYGDSIANAKPYRDADYTLYSILHDDARSDLSALPFHSLWQHVKKEAAVPGEDAEKSTIANMVSLNQAILTSPDITEKHALDLIVKYQNDVELIRNALSRQAKRGDTVTGNTKMDKMRSKSLEILKKL